MDITLLNILDSLEFFYILDVKTNEILYISSALKRNFDKFANNYKECGKLGEIRIGGRFYECITTSIDWKGREALLILLRDITRYRRNESLLRESRDRFRILSEKSLAGVYLIQEGKIKYVNPRLAEMLGYTIEELLDRQFVELVHPGDLSKMQESLEKFMSGKSDFIHQIIRTIRKDEKIIELEIFGSGAIYQGKPTIIGTVIDVTEKNRKKKLHKLLHKIDLYILSGKDIEEVLPYICQNLVECYNLRYACIEIEDVLTCHGRKEKNESAIEIPIKDKEKEIGRIILGLNKKDFFDEVIKEELDVLAKQIAVLLTAIKTQKTLKEREKSYRVLFENFRDALIIVDVDGRILHANPTAIKLFGYTLNKFKNKNIEELIAIKEKEGKEHEIIAKRRKIIAEIDKVETTYMGKKAFLFVIRDITYQKKMKENLLKSHKKLEQAYKELKSLDTIKSNIITNISHELKTPITIAKGLMELGMEEEDVSLRREYLRRGIASLNRLTRIVDDLIHIAKMEKKEDRFDLEPLNVSDLVAIVVKEILPKAKIKKISIYKKIPENLYIYADFKHISHAIYNLLDNAVKFNKEDGEIEIKAKDTDDMVEICIRDTGVGIKIEEQEKIFQKFYQANATMRRKHGGTGIGLSVVKEIIDAHGGKIWFESKVGEGSTFCIQIPKAMAVSRI